LPDGSLDGLFSFGKIHMRGIAWAKPEETSIEQNVWRVPAPLSPLTVVVRSDSLVEAEIDNEIVALNIRNGTCYGLNSVGSRIWRLLSAPIRISDLCTVLQGEYKVAQNDCERQVLDLLEELRAEDLITVVEETGTGMNSAAIRR
jgi:hypothetical protein